MMLLFNSLYYVGSVYANSDPFFLTQATRTAPNYPRSYYEFRAGQPVATLVYRDRIQLKLDPKKPPYASFKAAGSISDVWLAWHKYVSNQSVSWKWEVLKWDFSLLSEILLAPLATFPGLTRSRRTGDPGPKILGPT